MINPRYWMKVRCQKSTIEKIEYRPKPIPLENNLVYKLEKVEGRISLINIIY